MTHRSNARGSFRLDRRFGPVGRIDRASGTTDVKLFRRLNDMLTTLYETGRWDLLSAIRDGWMRPLEVWSAFRESRLDTLPTVDHVRSLKSAVDRWLPQLTVTERHRATYRRLFDRLIVAKAALRDLPNLLADFRQTCEGKGHARTFNLARAGCKAFLRDTVGREDPLYRKLDRVRPLKELRRPGKKLTIAEVADIASRLRSYGGEWWSLCMTGMRRGEYWGEWEVGTDRIIIHGTKSAAAVRAVPLAFPIIRPRIGHWGFGQALRKATGGTIRPHDSRHTYINWMADAGIPRIRRIIYAGHELGRDVTELYERHDVSKFLSEDAARLRDYIGEETKQAMSIVP